MGDRTSRGSPGRAPGRLSEAIRAEARRIGFALAGIVDPRPSGHIEFYERWLREGLHGGMDYLARPSGVERRRDPALADPFLRSIVVVGDEYHREDAEGIPDDPSKGVIAKYARGRDYHRVIRAKLKRLHRWIEGEAGRAVEGRAVVDRGPVLEREIGARGGLGWFGKNTMLIHPKRGSYFFLGLLLLDLALEADEPFTEDHCGSCVRCLEACPTGALLGRDASGAPVMDARRCISYLTIEHRGPIDPALRPFIGNRIHGCDICQDICPWNERFARRADEPGYAARGPGEPPAGVEPEGGEGREGRAGPSVLPPEGRSPGPSGAAPSASPHPGTAAPALTDLMRMSEAEWERFSRGSAIRRAGYRGFKRNVSVALGNWLGGVERPDPEAVLLLAAALGDPEPLLRRHAAWALGRAASPESRRALRRREAVESDPAVRKEIRAALDAARGGGRAD